MALLILTFRGNKNKSFVFSFLLVNTNTHRCLSSVLPVSELSPNKAGGFYAKAFVKVNMFSDFMVHK